MGTPDRTRRAGFFANLLGALLFARLFLCRCGTDFERRFRLLHLSFTFPAIALTGAAMTRCGPDNPADGVPQPRPASIIAGERWSAHGSRIIFGADAQQYDNRRMHGRRSNGQKEDSGHADADCANLRKSHEPILFHHNGEKGGGEQSGAWRENPCRRPRQ